MGIDEAGKRKAGYPGGIGTGSGCHVGDVATCVDGDGGVAQPAAILPQVLEGDRLERRGRCLPHPRHVSTAWRPRRRAGNLAPMPADKTTRLIANGRVWSGVAAHAGVRTESVAIAEQGGKIVAVAQLDELRRRYPGAGELDAGGRLVTPGLVDCHTHIVYAGNRAAEIERRLAGESYESIARAGGGIVSTVRATRAAALDALIDAALPRVDALLAEGVTTLEVKSGYGLELQSELRMLQAARDLGKLRRLTVVTTYLGAHALPPERAGDSDGYVEQLCRELIPAVAVSRLADAFDAYCERMAFSADQVARAFEVARAHQLPVKLHADQLSNMHGAALAARHDALSADHLEYTDVEGVAALAAAGTVAVLLPGAFHFLRESQRPPIDALRRAGVPMAVATDCNPGTSPMASILTAMNFAALEFGLSTAEALNGVTAAAARALGLLPVLGTIEVGKWCDLAVWNVAEPAELVQGIGMRPLHRRVWHGHPDP
ncbi:MAG TPA: imidazolonepropionase [Burkholderiaceae bacterium]|nr:imidazolonepropionase [Burkholderiaceae bacterium]